MSDFTTKFNLLKEIEKAANKRSKPIAFLIENGETYSHQEDERFSCLKIEINHIDYELYFDHLDRDKFHDLYEDSREDTELPYFRDMNFEDESIFILTDEYNIVKFIKNLEICDLEEFLTLLEEK